MPELLEFLQKYPVVLNVVTGFITFVVGLFIGHKTALWRDKRKEFNELAKPIKVALELNLRESRSKKIDVQDLLSLELMLSGRKKRRYKELCENYQKYFLAFHSLRLPYGGGSDQQKAKDTERRDLSREVTKELNDFIKLK